MNYISENFPTTVWPWYSIKVRESGSRIYSSINSYHYAQAQRFRLNCPPRCSLLWFRKYFLQITDLTQEAYCVVVLFMHNNITQLYIHFPFRIRDYTEKIQSVLLPFWQSLDLEIKPSRLKHGYVKLNTTTTAAAAATTTTKKYL